MTYEPLDDPPAHPLLADTVETSTLIEVGHGRLGLALELVRSAALVVIAVALVVIA